MKSTLTFIITTIVLITKASSAIQHHTIQQISEKIAQTKMMYGATIRLKNLASGYQ